MLSRFYQNTCATFRQWFETMQLAVKPAPIPVRIRVETAEQLKLAAQQRRMMYSKYRS